MTAVLEDYTKQQMERLRAIASDLTDLSTKGIITEDGGGLTMSAESGEKFRELTREQFVERVLE